MLNNNSIMFKVAEEGTAAPKKDETKPEGMAPEIKSKPDESTPVKKDGGDAAPPSKTTVG